MNIIVNVSKATTDGGNMKKYRVADVCDNGEMSAYAFIVEAEDNASDDEIMAELGKINFWKMEKVSDGVYTNEYRTREFAVDRR